MYLHRCIRSLLIALLLGAAPTALAVTPVSHFLLSEKDLPAGCKPTKEDGSSLHAASAYETLMEEPSGGKAKQLFACKGRLYALYLYEYGTATSAYQNAAIIGARLWGNPNGPSGHHQDEVLLGGPVIVVISPAPGPLAAVFEADGFEPFRHRKTKAPRAEADPVDLGDAELKKLKAAVDCKAQAFFCKALDRFAKGKPAKGPSDTRAFGGATLLVVLDEKDPAARYKQEAGYLVLSNREALYGTVKPSNAEEEGQVKTFLSYVKAGKAIPAADPLMGYVRTLTSKPLKATKTVGRSTAYLSSNHILVREDKDTFVVIEHQPDNGDGFYVGIFPKKG